MRLTPLALLLLLAGCAGHLPPDLLKPRAVTTEIPVLNWPMVELEVVDERWNSAVAHEALVSAIESTIRRAASVSSPADSPDLRLTVTVVRHEAAFAGGGSPWWTGATELRAVLKSANGDTIANWTVQDTSQEWNVWGYSSGTDAAQDSLKDGLRTLLHRMAAQVQFGKPLPSGAVILRPSTIAPSEQEPSAPAPAGHPMLCRERAKSAPTRELWIVEYRRCMAGD